MIYLCAISNISSGSCSEDCSFCTQSARYHVDIEKYKQKSIEQIVEEAKAARKNRALGFCLVTAGKGMTPSKLEYVTTAARAVKEAVPELNIIACNGTASYEDMIALKEAGIRSYNHNLEASENYYKDICSTHEWKERYKTCLNAKKAGLKLISGGIFGMGESEEDRVSMINSLKELQPVSITINFFHPNSALPLKTNPLNIEESLKLINNVKNELSNSRIMVAGGRERMFGKRWTEIFDHGANSIVIGDYLTTSGESPSKDLAVIESLGLEIAEKCNGQ
ncbi:MAG: biotin synthase [Epsilonproteobacteria bacterium]|nr:biotin synthase [Campylobacterota bacterium]